MVNSGSLLPMILCGGGAAARRMAHRGRVRKSFLSIIILVLSLTELLCVWRPVMDAPDCDWYKRQERRAGEYPSARCLPLYRYPPAAGPLPVTAARWPARSHSLAE